LKQKTFIKQSQRKMQLARKGGKKNKYKEGLNISEHFKTKPSQQKPPMVLFHCGLSIAINTIIVVKKLFD